MAARVEVRPFQLRDLDRVLEIERGSFGPDAWDRDLFLEYFRRCPDLFLIARSGRRISGYIITCTTTKEAELVSIAVDPRDRRKRVGRALLDATLAQLRPWRPGAWWLMVATTNESAIRFYEGYGFVRKRRTKRYYGAGRDAWRMKFKF